MSDWKRFCGLDSLKIIKYSSPESHMLSLAIFLLRKTTLFQMFLSWWIATSPVLGSGCILPVHASVRGVSFKIAVSIKNTSWLYGNAKILKGFKVTIHLRHLCPGPCNAINCFPWNPFFYCSGRVLFLGTQCGHRMTALKHLLPAETKPRLWGTCIL